MLQLVDDGLYAYRGDSTQKIAAFDLDWTLTRAVRSRFFKDSSDFSFLPNRISTLKKLKSCGYTIVIFTNQGYKGDKLITALERVNNIIEALKKEGIDPWVLVANSDEYKKPNTKMWQVFVQYFPNYVEAWFVGDAAGRPQDHSDFDLKFAQGVGIKFYTPEEIFPTNEVVIPETQVLFLFVGMPGVGKSTFYKQYLEPKGFVHANQDQLKTKAKVLKLVKESLASGKSVAVDATNPSLEKRREFISLANEKGVPVVILYFTGNGYNLNKLREHPVPDIVYNVYFKTLEEPSFERDHVPVVEL